MIWTIIITPFWAAVSDAMVKHDYTWIKNAEKKYLKVFILFVLGGILMLLFSSYAYNLWIGDKILITNILSFWILMYSLVTMFSSIYVTILNGMGLLKVQNVCLSFFSICISRFMLYVCPYGIRSTCASHCCNNK